MKYFFLDSSVINCKSVPFIKYISNKKETIIVIPNSVRKEKINSEAIKQIFKMQNKKKNIKIKNNFKLQICKSEFIDFLFRKENSGKRQIKVKDFIILMEINYYINKSENNNLFYFLTEDLDLLEMANYLFINYENFNCINFENKNELDMKLNEKNGHIICEKGYCNECEACSQLEMINYNYINFFNKEINDSIEPIIYNEILLQEIKLNYPELFYEINIDVKNIEIKDIEITNIWQKEYEFKCEAKILWVLKSKTQLDIFVEEEKNEHIIVFKTLAIINDNFELLQIKRTIPWFF
ncbi:MULTISPECIES: hypothetical protein [Mesoplasma]|uniref:PIN domain-containing protein n=1 Tax=Mesoplasma florum TaxID=2151 RepID=A0A2R3P7B6_MESFO|nr:MULTISPECIES: hypothetical protein [Mesoplasma]AVN64365.1 hypothetical protein CG003_01640 [Mesoplasma florum]